MARLTHAQMLVGDNKVARDIGYEDAMRERPCEPGQVPKDVRSAYSAGYARAEAAKAADADIWSTGRRSPAALRRRAASAA